MQDSSWHNSDAILCCGPASMHLERPLARLLGVEVATVEHRTFPDGEGRIFISRELAGTVAVVVQGTHPPQDQRLQQLFQLVDAVVDSGAKLVVAVVPYLAYARQDRRFRRGEPHSLAVVVRTLAALGCDELIVVEPHNAEALQRLGLPATCLSTVELVASALLDTDLDDPVVLSPDVGGRGRVTAIAKRLTAEALFLEKRKDETRTYYSQLDVDLTGRDVVVVDDVCSSGSTIIPLAERVAEAGAARMTVAVTHLLADGERLLRAVPLPTRLIATDTVPGTWSTISTAELLAEAVASISAAPRR
jgi:ribose-phosphate pyrophosphokinase